VIGHTIFTRCNEPKLSDSDSGDAEEWPRTLATRDEIRKARKRATRSVGPHLREKPVRMRKASPRSRTKKYGGGNRGLKNSNQREGGENLLRGPKASVIGLKERAFFSPSPSKSAN